MQVQVELVYINFFACFLNNKKPRKRKKKRVHNYFLMTVSLIYSLDNNCYYKILKI